MNESSSGRRTSEVSLTVALSTLMAVVAVVLAAFLVLFNYQRNHDAALLAAEDLLVALAEQIEDRVLGIVRPIVSIAELTPELAPIGIDEEGITPSLRSFLIRVVERFPQVDSVYVGLEDGSFFRIASLRSYNDDQRKRSEVPTTAVIAQFTIAPIGESAPRESIEYLAVDGSPVAPPRSRESPFDPRKRPWYASAARGEHVIATPPYRFSSSGEVGLTAARRLTGERAGVFGVDLTLIDLSNFLALQRPTPDTRIYLFTPEGKVLAWVGEGDSHSVAGADDERADAVPGLADFADPFASILHTHLLEGGELPPEMQHQGRTYITRRADLIGPLGSENFLGIVVPADHFTGRITDLGRKSALISIGFILATVPLIAFASRIFSRPLQALAAEADAIRAFELERPVEVHSRVREIHALSASMDRMKSGLRTFGVYVPRDLVRQMMSRSSPPKLGGERREITVLFTDIAGFTPIADGLEPEVVMQRMSRYFETATAALRGQGGTIDKFMGDAVMAMWNALVEDPEHAHSGCRGVLATRAALTALNAHLLAEGLAPMPTRFGLHTGEAVVGNVGSADRMNFTALGATVNLAARLEPLNKVYGTEILVSDDIAGRVRGDFHLRSVAIVKPKGVARPLRVHELIAEKRSSEDLGWTEQWEAAFEAFVAGDLGVAAREFAELAETLTADPVRKRLLERSASARDGIGTVPWNPVDTF